MTAVFLLVTVYLSDDFLKSIFLTGDNTEQIDEVECLIDKEGLSAFCFEG